MRKKPLCLLCIFFLLLRLAATLIMGKTMDNPAFPSSTTIQIEGTVLQKSITSKQQILTIGNLEKQSRQKKKQYIEKEKIVIYDDSFRKVKIGDRICVKGDGETFEEARNPGNFDQREYYRKKHTTGFLWAKEILVTERAKVSLEEMLFRMRQRSREVFEHCLGKKNGGILAAMVLGEKAGMDPEVKELYQKSGISHLLAISGLHISLIGNAFYQWLRKGGCSFCIAGITSAVVLGGYACMTGMSVSTQRAFFMFLLRIGADVAGRVYDLPTALAVAAAWIAAENPDDLTDAAFLLSFGAILGIVLLCPIFQEIFAGEKKWLQTLSGSLAIIVMLHPILSFFYYEISLYAIFLNLLVIPLMSWILGTAIIGLFLAVLWMPGGSLVLKSSGFLLEGYELLCRMFLRLPNAVVVTGKPEIWKIVIYYCLLFAFVMWWRRKIIEKKMEEKKGKWKKEVQNRVWNWKQKVGSVLWITGLALILIIEIGKEELEVTFLDVGQGDGIFLQTDTGLTCMIDGGSTDIKQVGKYRIEPFLKSKGVRKLDYVFVTHGDQDHLNGIVELMERQAYGISIDTLVLPRKDVWDDTLWQLAYQADMQGVSVVAMHEGESVEDARISIECIHPAENSEADPGNASSLVLKVTCQNVKLLLTGDVEGKGEEELIDRFSEEIFLLKVAHHGSKNSTRELFLEQVKPKYAIISAGRNNSYGHPNQETIQRLKQSGVKIYSTQDNGAICFRIDDGKGHLSGWK